MSLNLLLDEDSQAKMLVKLLKAAGHKVLTINELEMVGQPDSAVFIYAKREDLVLLTRNCADFQILHESQTNHPGILAVYQEADESKNMSYRDIARAISNLEESGVVIVGQFIVLNQWRY